MSRVDDLRAKIASGEIKAGGGGEKGVGEGLFLCSVESAEFNRGNGGNLRGAVRVKVLDGGTDKDIGGKFNIYMQTVNESFAEKTVAEWGEPCKAWGISEDKIYEDAESVSDILGNICTLINKQAMKGGLRLVVDRKKSGKVDPKSNKPFYWNNLKDATRDAPATAPAAPQAVAPVAAPVAVAAPAAAPAAPAKKAWMK